MEEEKKIAKKRICYKIPLIQKTFVRAQPKHSLQNNELPSYTKTVAAVIAINVNAL